MLPSMLRVALRLGVYCPQLQAIIKYNTYKTLLRAYTQQLRQKPCRSPAQTWSPFHWSNLPVWREKPLFWEVHQYSNCCKRLVLVFSRILFLPRSELELNPMRCNVYRGDFPSQCFSLHVCCLWPANTSKPSMCEKPGQGQIVWLRLVHVACWRRLAMDIFKACCDHCCIMLTMTGWNPFTFCKWT